MPIEERRNLMKTQNRCFNCLNNNHNVYTCKSKFRCRQCSKKHHTLLHEKLQNQKEIIAAVPNNQSQGTNQSSSHHQICNTTTNQLKCSVLPTALLNIRDGWNQLQPCRVLLDSGSQCSFITESCVQRFHLKRSSARLAIAGIGGAVTGYTKGSVSLIASPFNKPETKIHIEAFVFPQLTAKPSSIQYINIEDFNNFDLADPDFHKGLQIDIIIGADIFFDLLLEGKIITTSKLLMQKTKLGWVVAGSTENRQAMQSMTVTVNNPEDSLDHQLHKFWEIESMNLSVNKLTKEEVFCEKHFTQHTRTDATGRFKVRLPFKIPPQSIGDSYRAAAQRMHAMERKFNKNKEFAQMYKDFMAEYLQLNHMKPLSRDDEKTNGYYLPHHGVIKDSSSTTKLRVVFDGSTKGNTGKSLNDCLAVGPTVQSTLYEILLRFRKYKVAFTADVEKMFRQVLVAKEDTKYQRILWRNSSDTPFTTYELQTITYGTASATYLATRAINESTVEFEKTHSNAVFQIKNNMYVDDLMTGADSIVEAMQLKDEITTILSTSGFNLRKWLSNEKEIFKNKKPNNENYALEIEPSTSVKVLGLYWNPDKDCFQFQVNLSKVPNITKRGILSESSRIFDPLGWLAPVTIKIKTFFQKLWIENLNWDDQLPPHLSAEWSNIRSALPKIKEIELNRYINTTKLGEVALHGFSDA